MRRTIVFAVGLVLLLGVGVAVAFVWRAVDIANEAEHNLMAAQSLARSVERYVVEHGDWPESYDALEDSPITSPIYRWPQDREEILKRAQIDFGVSLEEVASSRAPHRFLTYESPMYETSLAEDLKRVVNAVKGSLEKSNATSTP